jgi:hypothetical protein
MGIAKENNASRRYATGNISPNRHARIKWASDILTPSNIRVFVDHPHQTHSGASSLTVYQEHDSD